MKTVWNILKRVLLAVFLLVYVAVALVNSSIVQSYLGTYVGRYFSREWGGTVKVGSLHATPFDHVILDNLLLVAPDGDTLAVADHITARFRKFPFHKGGLDFDRVYIRNTYYHLEAHNKLTNLQYIIDYYNPDHIRHKPTGKHFVVKVGQVVLNGVHFKLDIDQHPRYVVPDTGVVIPHMEFRDIKGKIRNVRVDNDYVDCRVVHLETTERSGFRLESLSADVKVSPYIISAHNADIVTGSSHILCDAELTYDTWLAMRGLDYCNNVNHDVLLREGTTISLADVAYWAPVLWGADGQIEALGRFSGPVNNLHAEGVHFSFGDMSVVDLFGSVVGLPVVDDLEFDIRLERLLTNFADLQGLGFGKSQLKLNFPSVLAKLGNVEASANMLGGLQRCTATLQAITGLGDVEASASLAQVGADGNYAYSANLSSDGFGIAALVPNEWVARTGIDIAVNGEGFDLATATASLDGRLFNTTLHGKRIASTSISAQMQNSNLTADIAMSDTLGNVSLSGNAGWADSTLSASVDLAVADLCLSEFGIMEGDSLVVSTQLRADIEAQDIEHLNATVSLDNTNINQVGRRLDLSNVTLKATEKDGRKSVNLSSDIVRASLDGYFSYANIGLTLRNMIDRFVPTEYNPYVDKPEPDYQPAMADVFNFSVVIDDEYNRLGSFVPNIGVANHTTLTGSYSYAETLKMVLRSDSVRFGSVRLTNLFGNSRSIGSGYRMLLESDELLIGNREVVQNIDLAATSDTAGIVASLRWDDDLATTLNEGDLSFRLADNRIDVANHTFYINGDQWDIACPEGIALANGGLSVASLGIGSDGSGIKASASVTGQYNDYVELQFDRLGLQRLTGVLLQSSPLDVSGDLSGRFSLYGITDRPYFNAILKVDSCLLNSYQLGDVDIQSSWNSEFNILNLYLTSLPLMADGYVALGGSEAEMDFAVDFLNLNLSMFEPVLANVASRFGGILRGGINVSGTLQSPEIRGAAIVDNGIISLPITGVTYTFNDSVEFDSNVVRLENFRIVDPQGNIAAVSGEVAYNGPDNVAIAAELHTDNFMVLNSRPNGDSFYGTLYIEADGVATGSLNGLDVNLEARTARGSTLTVPISNRRQVQAQNYITFVSDSPEPIAAVSKRNQRQQSGMLTLQASLDITRDLMLNLPMDFSEVKAKMSATGAGDILFSLGNDGQPNVLGSYIFNSGSMKLNLASILEKSFTIDNGSSLTFQGDVMSTMFDINAVYSQRVSLNSLTGMQASETTQKTVQVEDVINIAGTLQNPEIGFDIRLPNTDQSVQEEVYSYIDRSNERDMLNQAMSLLLFGRFANNSTTSPVTVGDAASVNGASVVADALSSVISDMVQFVDVNVDYRGATSLTTEQVEVDISKEWRNVYFTSSLGYGGETHELSSEAEGSTLVGDLLVGWRVTPALHLFAYNRSNTNDYTRVDMPFKQGVGLKLTKDFDRWSELFFRKKKQKQGTK
ncbi:MAG: translocation/assembly module TamB domain-containing protein [Bacteroidales bacterium]|nr:translocation/assembly module TamB domain-containing protein [Bacteroidales bacterium]